MQNESDEIKTMRAMEWERVKGGIRAILAAYWNIERDDFDELHAIIEDFILNFGEKGGID